MKASTTFVMVVAATAAGVAIGLLLAPEKGSDLQKRIGKKADDVLRELSAHFSFDDETANPVEAETQKLLGSPSSSLKT
jgi:gas vesicle protein